MPIVLKVWTTTLLWTENWYFLVMHRFKHALYPQISYFGSITRISHCGTGKSHCENGLLSLWTVLGGWEVCLKWNSMQHSMIQLLINWHGSGKYSCKLAEVDCLYFVALNRNWPQSAGGEWVSGYWNCPAIALGPLRYTRNRTTFLNRVRPVPFNRNLLLLWKEFE